MGKIYIILYPLLNFIKEQVSSVNPWFFMIIIHIHRNELQIDLITGASCGINLSSLNLFNVCLSIHGEDLRVQEYINKSMQPP